MASLIVADVIGGEIFEDLLAEVQDIRPALREWVRMRRGMINLEFLREGWFAPGGGFVPWQKTRDFGTRKAPRKTLSRTAALLRAWTGVGLGALERVTDKAATFGVSGLRFPYAAVHRGGAGEVGTGIAGVPARIPVTQRMRFYLGLTFGVWLRSGKRFIEIPRRPHATNSPEARTRTTALFVDFIRQAVARVA